MEGDEGGRKQSYAIAMKPPLALAARPRQGTARSAGASVWRKGFWASRQKFCPQKWRAERAELTRIGQAGRAAAPSNAVAR